MSNYLNTEDLSYNILLSGVEADDDEDLQMVQQMAYHQEQEKKGKKKHRGSIPGHAFLWRDREQGHQRLYQDYFAENPVYPKEYFRRRYRMYKPLFYRILNGVESYDNSFVQRENNAKVKGFSSIQKCTAALRMLAYGAVGDSIDEYCRMGKSTAIETLRNFVKAVVMVFGDEYLRAPNEIDTARLLAVGETRGFPGMLGSINCMHWKWRNCPTAWKGMYTGRNHEPTIILEAVASYDLWIWHAFFGLPGSLNDINVLDRSPVFSDLAEGITPKVSYSINGHNYTMGYYLADGIYPAWSTFVKTIPCPQGNKKKYFAKKQESARKDVERAFGVLQTRWAIIRGPARLWDVETLEYIMKACIIMHNMIIEDEKDIPNPDYNYDTIATSSSHSTVSNEITNDIMQFIQAHHRFENREMHRQLQEDLVNHLWQENGDA